MSASCSLTFEPMVLLGHPRFGGGDWSYLVPVVSGHVIQPTPLNSSPLGVATGPSVPHRESHRTCTFTRHSGRLVGSRVFARELWRPDPGHLDALRVAADLYASESVTGEQIAALIHDYNESRGSLQAVASLVGWLLTERTPNRGIRSQFAKEMPGCFARNLAPAFGGNTSISELSIHVPSDVRFDRVSFVGQDSERLPTQWQPGSAQLSAAAFENRCQFDRFHFDVDDVASVDVSGDPRAVPLEISVTLLTERDA